MTIQAISTSAGIVEDVGGAPLFEQMQARIFNPLGMSATGPSDPLAVLKARADGYEWVGDHYENRPALPAAVAYGAGALVSTIEDLVRWDRALSTRAILSSASYAEIEKAGALNDGSSTPFDYGFGWFISGREGARIIQHGGGAPGFASIYYRYPDQKLSVIALTNHADRVLDMLAVDIAGVADNSLLRAQSGDADTTKTEFIREIVESLFAGARNRDRFTDAMNLFLDSETGKGFWLWCAAMGALGDLNCPEIWPSDRGELVVCRISLGGEPYWLSARIGEGEKISRISLW